VASLDDQVSTTFELGRDVNSGPHSLKFTTDKPVPGPRLLLVTAGPFTKVSGGRELGSRQVASWATLDRDRTHGTMYFCVRPQARLSTSSSGQYTGALTLEQGRVQRLDVPVTLDAPYPRWDLVFLVGLGVCVLCSAYTFFLRRPSLTAGTAGAPSDAEKDKTDDKAAAAAERATSVFRYPFGFLKDWLLFYTGILGVLTLVAGLVAASTAFVAQYISSETWDASTSTWITFVGALATAFIAGATAGKLAQIQFTTNLTPPESPADNSHGV
jgi:hypothetical protein